MSTVVLTKASKLVDDSTVENGLYQWHIHRMEWIGMNEKQMNATRSPAQKSIAFTIRM